ncbi:MAG: methylated-DNA--[protein]-cysteine S-methyltransferase [Hyphomicrobiaceae bacterium]|nr:methylated-DNA--[protein]-cysteine S-methyltransferase [Hyphomicrobiaceae bacterium]
MAGYGADQTRDKDEAACQSDDYARVRAALKLLSEDWRRQPRLDQLASHLNLSPFHTQRLFRRWCGLSPKEFAAAVTLDHARRMLHGSETLLATACETGLSGPSRLHDLFVTHEAISPGDVRRRGTGLEMRWGVHATPFGRAVAVASPRGLAGLAFVDEDKGQTPADALADLARRWPLATMIEAASATADDIARIFRRPSDRAAVPVRLVLIGTDFEIRVWEALLDIPIGRAVSYGDVARRVCTSRAARAVGAAVGRNPLSFVVPCHRVLRADGGLGGYHWGLTRKRAILGWEAGQIDRPVATNRDAE